MVSQLQNKLLPDVDLELITPEGRTPYGYPSEEAEKASAPVLVLDPAAIVTETISYSGAPDLLTTDKTEAVTLEDVIAGRASLEDLTAQLTVEEMADLTVGTARFGSVGAPLCMTGGQYSYDPGNNMNQRFSQVSIITNPFSFNT